VVARDCGVALEQGLDFGVALIDGNWFLHSLYNLPRFFGNDDTRGASINIEMGEVEG
jgi:hypothetical protein